MSNPGDTSGTAPTTPGEGANAPSPYDDLVGHDPANETNAAETPAAADLPAVDIAAEPAPAKKDTPPAGSSDTPPAK